MQVFMIHGMGEEIHQVISVCPFIVKLGGLPKPAKINVRRLSIMAQSKMPKKWKGGGRAAIVSVEPGSLAKARQVSNRFGCY